MGLTTIVRPSFVMTDTVAAIDKGGSSAMSIKVCGRCAAGVASRHRLGAATAGVAVLRALTA